MKLSEKSLDKMYTLLKSNTFANWIQAWASIIALTVAIIALIVALKK